MRSHEDDEGDCETMAAFQANEINKAHARIKRLRTALGYIRDTTNEDGIAAYVDEILEMDE